MLFEIDGYWKDDKSKFSGYIVKDNHTVAKNDDNVFFYGLSEKSIKEAIKEKRNTANDFVITAYRRMI